LEKEEDHNTSSEEVEVDLEDGAGAVRFRHDSRLVLPSRIYLTPEQVVLVCTVHIRYMHAIPRRVCIFGAYLLFVHSLCSTFSSRSTFHCLILVFYFDSILLLPIGYLLRPSYYCSSLVHIRR
jgi:hypothetical protein